MESDRHSMANIGWSGPARVVASLVIAWHLVGVLVGPFSMEPTIPGDFLRPWYTPYITALDIDHAYKFFAPDPGPSHVIRYVLEMPDGTTREGRLPDRDADWPRLLYHRHFMLSEFIHDGRPDELWNNNPLPAGAAPPPHVEAFIKSYAQHLLRAAGARKVSLYYRLHLIAPPQMVADGETKPEDERWYRERLLGTFTENRS